MADNGIGSIIMFGGISPIAGYLSCDGRLYAISQYRDLFNVIGTTYGGDGVATFATPDLSSRIPIHVGSGPGLSPRTLGQKGGSEQASLSVAQMAAHTHAMSGGEAPATDRGATSTSGLAESQGRIYEAGTSPVAMSSVSVSTTGVSTPHNNVQPFLALNFLIAWQANTDFTYGLNPFLAEIRMFGGNFVPKGWAACEGQVMFIRNATALFSLLGTTYGGDGLNTFALPDLRGLAPMGVNFTGSLSQHFLGDSGGSQSVMLTTANLPAHAHAVTGSSAVALSNDPAGKTLGVPFSGDNLYAPAAGTQTGLTGVLGSTGGNQPHNNMQPYLAVNYMIALQGTYPQRP